MDLDAYDRRRAAPRHGSSSGSLLYSRWRGFHFLTGVALFLIFLFLRARQENANHMEESQGTVPQNCSIAWALNRARLHCEYRLRNENANGHKRVYQLADPMIAN